MGRRCVVLAALGACATDPVVPNAPVDPDDIDGDGIANAIDNCAERSNSSQHDEDADGHGDPCDVCPTVADPAQIDLGEQLALQFGDGVGDACDPRSSRDGDVLAALHLFSTDTSAEWIG